MAPMTSDRSPTPIDLDAERRWIPRLWIGLVIVIVIVAVLPAVVISWITSGPGCGTRCACDRGGRSPGRVRRGPADDTHRAQAVRTDGPAGRAVAARLAAGARPDPGRQLRDGEVCGGGPRGSARCRRGVGLRRHQSAVDGAAYSRRYKVGQVWWDHWTGCLRS